MISPVRGAEPAIPAASWPLAMGSEVLRAPWRALARLPGGKVYCGDAHHLLSLIALLAEPPPRLFCPHGVVSLGGPMHEGGRRAPSDPSKADSATHVPAEWHLPPPVVLWNPVGGCTQRRGGRIWSFMCKVMAVLGGEGTAWPLCIQLPMRETEMPSQGNPKNVITGWGHRRCSWQSALGGLLL